MSNSVSLSPITIREFSEPDRAAVQEAVVRAVEDDPERFLKRYVEHPESHEGRYISADLFKEMFDAFAQSKEARGRYNTPVHNAAAVLSAEQFRKVVHAPHSPGEHVLFLTGIPGAGKTSTIVRSGALPSDVRLVFEGQMSNPRTGLEKIGMVIDAGLKPLILVVHPTPENALDNTLQRFVEYGRGAGLGIMAAIQGNLPASLEAIHARYGDRIALEIKDVRDRNAVISYSGWEHLPILRSEGSRDQIYERLVAALNAQREAGAISQAAYDQAFGRVQPEPALLAGQHGQGHRGDAPGREHPQISGEASLLTPIKPFIPGDGEAVKPLIVPDRTQAERMAGVVDNENVVRSAIDMNAKLCATFKHPDVALALVENAIRTAPPGSERAHVEATALKQVRSLELRGSDRLLDFQGRAARSAARQELPGAIDSIKHHTLSVEHHAKHGDREHLSLQKQCAVAIPDASPELRALLAAPDAQSFAATLRAGDKEEILGNAESLLASIEARIGNARSSEDGARIGVSEGQLAHLRSLKSALHRVEQRAQTIEESPSINKSEKEGPRLVR
ncbi:hypothetical protein OOT33_17225 [Sphingobium sp. DEHP117]|uniref:hypothetical protein n=1 Tax=Sphingobium sp. DEHP117 TaxID=2993436 RepID=UPI0027D71BF9|nr:hypothetical protein [Sphingobium sp. DEHP117]MDQ4422154.1 hypothetical protein [Sphingobium sp. DEHP117]